MKMDRLGEIVRLNDDKLYSQLINYRGKNQRLNSQRNKEDQSTNENIDDLDGLAVRAENDKNRLHDNRYHQRHRKKRIKSTKHRIGDKAVKNNPTRSNLNSRDDSNRLIIDLDMINKSTESFSNETNTANDQWTSDNGPSDELHDGNLDDDDNYFFDNTTAIVNNAENKNLSRLINLDNLHNNLTYKYDFDDYDSIEIINLSIEDQINKNHTNRLSSEQISSTNSTIDNLVELLDSPNLLISSASNRLVLDELNQTSWLLKNDENVYRNFETKN